MLRRSFHQLILKQSDFALQYSCLENPVDRGAWRAMVEIDVFLELSCFFDDPMDIGNLISGSSAFSKSNLNTLFKFTIHVLLKPGLDNFEHY